MNMDRKEFFDRLFARAKSAGFTACEAYFAEGSSFECEVFNGEIVNYNAADSIGLGFRGLFGGKMGYASTQALDADAIDLLVLGAKENAELIECDDPQSLFPGGERYQKVAGFREELEKIPTEEKIRMARAMEKAALAAHPEIRRVGNCMLISARDSCVIVNSLGLNVSHSTNAIGGYITAVAERDGDVNTGSAYFFTNDPKKIDPESIAKKAADEAVKGLSSTSVQSGKMRVLFRNDCFASLLSTFSGVFSADRAQKGLSLLAGREGDVIASPAVSIIDDPHREDSTASSPFDGEGVATFKKRVVDNGRLETLLHNLRTAQKQGVKTTANASRASYSSVVGVSPSNFYVEPSKISFDALLESLGTGLYITDLQGLHAGANPTSGDFSLSARGFLVEAGKITRPVSNVTVAGNFFKMLKQVESVGADLQFLLPGASSFASPSVLVSALSAAGNDPSAT